MRKGALIEKQAYVRRIKGKRLLNFSRSQLCIPYALFLALFVVIPLFLVVYYAFVGEDGSLTLSNFISKLSSSSIS